MGLIVGLVYVVSFFLALVPIFWLAEKILAWRGYHSRAYRQLVSSGLVKGTQEY